MNDKIYVDLCDAINRHYDDYVNCKDEDEKVNMTLDVIRGLFALLKEIVKAGKFKDTFEYFYRVGVCIVTTAKSEKTNTAYSLTYDLYRHRLVFDTHIHNGKNLRHLQELFLLDFFTVLNEYNIQYSQTEIHSEAEEDHPELYKNKKGNLMPLMRNYYVNSIYGDDIALGMFEVVWNFDRPLNDIFAEACIAMKWLYKFNYNLWKIDDLKAKAKN